MVLRCKSGRAFFRRGRSSFLIAAGQAGGAGLSASGRAQRAARAPAQPVPAGRDPRGRDGPGDRRAWCRCRSASSAPRWRCWPLQLLTLKEAYDAVEWPVLILFGALIPVSEALQTTGATELIAGWLSAATQYLPPLGALGLMLIAAMALTPFLNNAATVLVMAPIAASLAGKLALSVDPFPDGGCSRRRLRLPHAHRAPVQHAGHGARRLSLRRLLASRPAPVSHRRSSLGRCSSACSGRCVERAGERCSATDEAACTAPPAVRSRGRSWLAAPPSSPAAAAPGAQALALAPFGHPGAPPRCWAVQVGCG